jgi:hypothetical protein
MKKRERERENGEKEEWVNVPFIYPNEAPLSDTHYPNGPNIKKP